MGILIAIIVVIWLRVKYKQNISHITLPIQDSEGHIQISSAAIRDFVKNFAASFPAIQIRQVQLIRRHKKYCLKIQADYVSTQDTLPQTAALFQQNLLAALSAQFGIREITDIHLLIRNTRIESQPSGIDVAK